MANMTIYLEVNLISVPTVSPTQQGAKEPAIYKLSMIQIQPHTVESCIMCMMQLLEHM